MEEITGVTCSSAALSAFMHAVQQQIFAHVILLQCRIMNLNILAALKLFAARLSKKRVWHLHIVFLFWEAEYRSKLWLYFRFHHWLTQLD
jgi:hypothetical protein